MSNLEIVRPNSCDVVEIPVHCLMLKNFNCVVEVEKNVRYKLTAERIDAEEYKLLTTPSETDKYSYRVIELPNKSLYTDTYCFHGKGFGDCISKLIDCIQQSKRSYDGSVPEVKLHCYDSSSDYHHHYWGTPEDTEVYEIMMCVNNQYKTYRAFQEPLKLDESENQNV